MTWQHFLDKCDGVEPPEPVTLFTVAGTWSPPELGFQADLARTLADNYRYVWRPVPYPASFGPVNPPYPNAPAYAESVAVGVYNLLRMVQETNGRFALFGFSQGGEVVARAQAQLGVHAKRCVAVVTFGDPARQRWDETVGGGTGWGISRFELTQDGVPRRTYAVPGDMYCTTPDGEAGDDMHAVYVALTRLPDVRGAGPLAQQVLKLLQNPLHGGVAVIDAVIRLIHFGITGAHDAYGQFIQDAAGFVRSRT